MEDSRSVSGLVTRARKDLARIFRRWLYRSKHLSNRALAVLFGAFALVLIFNGFLAYQSTQTHAHTDDRIGHTELVLSDIEAIATNLDNAESGQRGYILTGLASYLAPYNSSAANITNRLDQLAADLGRDSAQQASLAQLRVLVHDKYSEMQQTIDLRRSNQTQQAEQIVLSGQGKQRMDQINSVLVTMRSREHVLLGSEVAAAQTSLTEIISTFAFAAIVDLVLLCGIGWLVYRTFEERGRLLAREREAVQVRDQFLSIASHELKTPLTSLLINAQLLERRTEREGKVGSANHRSAGAIVRQSRRLRSLIDAMLDVSRIAGGQLSIQRERLDLAALAQTVVSETAVSSDRHTIIYTGPESPVMVDGDRTRLEEVLLNLVQNAIKYSPQGGTIEVNLRTGETDVYVSVRDTGIGIPAESLPRLFTPFYRATNAQSSRISGMGIGLAVVRDVVTLHDGEVSVESEVGEGSTFTIRMPLAPPAPERATAKSGTRSDGEVAIADTDTAGRNHQL